MAIIQGSNLPIIIRFSENVPTHTEFEVSLGIAGKEVKHWSEDDLVISGKDVKAPLTQEETLDLPAGGCTIEAKWLNSAGDTDFIEPIRDKIVARTDRTIMGDE